MQRLRDGFELKMAVTHSAVGDSLANAIAERLRGGYLVFIDSDAGDGDEIAELLLGRESRCNDECLLSGVIRQWRQLDFRLFVMANTSRWRNRPILNTTKHAFEGGIHDRL